MADPRIEPDVHDVRLLAQVARGAVRAEGQVAQELLRGSLPPEVAALPADHRGDPADPLGIQHQLAAVLAVQGGNGNPPDPLAADAPVGPIPHHVADPVLSPAGNPLDPLLDHLQGLIPELLHRHEPLGGGTEDDGFLAAPAVGVGMEDLLASQEPPRVGEGLQDPRGPVVQGHPPTRGVPGRKTPRSSTGFRISRP